MQSGRRKAEDDTPKTKIGFHSEAQVELDGPTGGEQLDEADASVVYPFVKILWRDPGGRPSSGAWVSVADLVSAQAPAVLSVGYLVASDKDHYTLAATVDVNALDCVSNTLVIPRSAVVGIVTTTVEDRHPDDDDD